MAVFRPPVNRDTVTITNAAVPALPHAAMSSIVTPAADFTDAYVLEPGSSGNNVSTPNLAAYDPAGDLTVIARVALDDWTPSAQQTIVSRRGATNAVSSWRLAISATGFPVFAVTVDGVNTSTATSSSPAAFGDGSVVWLRVTRTSSTGRVDFYFAPDQPAIPTVWTTLSPNQTTTAGALNAGSADIYVGGYNAGTLESLAGKVFQVVEIGGLNTTDTQLFNMKASDWTSGTTWVSAATGETWTINGTASVVPAVGSGPQTITAQVASVALTGVSGLIVPGGTTVTAQIATVALTAVPGLIVAARSITAQVATITVTAQPGAVQTGPATITAQIATLTLSAVPGSVAAARTVNATTATIALSGVPGSVQAGAATIAAQIASLALTAVPGAVTASKSITAQIASVALTAVPGTVSVGAVVISAQVATITLQAVTGTVTAGPITVTAQVATLTLTAVPGNLSAFGGSQTITAQIATVTLTAIPGSIAAARNLNAQVATLTLQAVAGTLTAGARTITAATATLTLTALQGSIAAGPISIAATPATLELTAVPGTLLNAGSGPVITGRLTTSRGDVDRQTVRGDADRATSTPTIERATTTLTTDRVLEPVS